MNFYPKKRVAWFKLIAGKSERELLSCQLILNLQEHVRYQTRPSTCDETYQGGTKVADESFQSVPSQANEKMEESGNNKCTSSCNVKDAHVKITMPSQSNNNNEDDLSTKDLLCLAWQITQGMVSRNWNSPENLKPNVPIKGACVYWLIQWNLPYTGITVWSATKCQPLVHSLFHYYA